MLIGPQARSAIVIGAADGIGRATVDRLVCDGVAVLAVDIAAERLLEAHGQNAAVHCLTIDVAAEDAAERIVAAAVDAFGGIDILVNNAGIRGRRARIDDTTDADWRHIQQINLDAPFRLARAASPMLGAGGSGRIINIGSIHGSLAAPTLDAFVVTKHGLNGLTRALALDLGPRGITVNCIMPGFIETGLTRSMAHDQPEIWGRLMSKIALGRQGAPAEIAAITAFLASENPGFISGACIPVDGGMSCWS